MMSEEIEKIKADIQKRMQKYPVKEKLFFIQLYDYNYPTCVSGTTKVFAEDIEDFAKHYLSLEEDEDRKERFLRSKSGEIITDYHSNDPTLNIVRQIEVENLGYRLQEKNERNVVVLNGYGEEVDYYFDQLLFAIRWMKWKNKYYKLVKPYGLGCCKRSWYPLTPWRRVTIDGNPFWLYEEASGIKELEETYDGFKETFLMSYVWQVADIFETKEELQKDKERNWLTKKQISWALRDLPGDAG